ncbi:hypothetical protein [Microbacterium sp.]|uniref:hypothetical protein n=1 Tax=Microbacterium sp. TaxID=51671 RepID=UPI003F95D21A
MSNPLIENETPADTFERLGISPGVWATAATTEWTHPEPNKWEVRPSHLNTRGALDLARLALEGGWAIAIHGSSSRLRIRIYRKEIK